MPIVSVILPVYNVESYLVECLDSLVKQTIFDIEIICIDDGSTDTSYEILQKYASQDKRIKIVKQENKGAALARNFGLRIANGKYVIFLDSDDYFDHCMLEKTVSRAETTNSDIVIFKALSFDEGSKNTHNLSHKMEKYPMFQEKTFSSNDIRNVIFNTFLPSAWNKLYRKSFLEENKLEFQNIKRSNDLLFTSKSLIKAKKIVLVNEFLLYYRNRLKNSLQATNCQTPLEFFKALIGLKEFLDAEKVMSLYLDSYYVLVSNVIFYNLKTMKNTSNKKEILDYLKQEGSDKLGLSRFYNFSLSNLYSFLQNKIIVSKINNKLFFLKLNRKIFKFFYSKKISVLHLLLSLKTRG